MCDSMLTKCTRVDLGSAVPALGYSAYVKHVEIVHSCNTAAHNSLQKPGRLCTLPAVTSTTGLLEPVSCWKG